MDNKGKKKREKEKEKQHHYTDSVAVFFTKDELQLHMHMATPFEGKNVIQQTFLNYQHGINVWNPEKEKRASQSPFVAGGKQKYMVIEFS